MSPYKKMITLVSALSLAATLTAAPAAKSMEGRARAIDLMSEGQTLENQGDTQTAYQKYYESSQLAPSPSAYYHLGRLARLSGQKDTARQWLNLALQMNPSFELAKVELIQLNNGKSQEAPIVNTVSNELDRTIAPGSADAANTPMNVDALRREVTTMQSLAPPRTVGASAVDQQASLISSADEPAKAAEPATPMDIILEEPSKSDNSEVSDMLSPTIDPKSDDHFGLPSLTQSSSKSGKSDTVPSAAELNDAAFGAKSQKDPGSIGYGQTTKVALGTFAFHREKGDDYRKANRFEDAAVEYKMALKLNPGDAETRTLLAEMYGRIGADEGASTQFAKAKTEAPNDDRVYYKEGNAYFDEQKYDLAIGSYTRALDLNPSNKLALNNMGVSYMEKKDYTRAADKFKAVLNIDPKYEMAVLNLGIIYDEHIVDPEQALKYYDQYLKLDGPRAAEVQRWEDAIRAKQ